MRDSKIRKFILSNDPGYYSEEFLENLNIEELQDIKTVLDDVLKWKIELKSKNEEIKNKNQNNN